MNQQAVLQAAGRFELVPSAELTPGPGEALLRVLAVGICGSDLHMFKEGCIGGIRIEDGPAPLVPGHEAVGVVEAVGAGVATSLVGQRVAIEPAINCGLCQWCLAGVPNVCPHHHFLGLPPCDGALRNRMLHPARLCVPVPQGISDDQAVMLEPLAIALHALDRVEFIGGQGALVLGCGPVGLSIIMLLAASGCHPIIASEKLDYRLNLARQVGATHGLNPTRDDVPAQVAKISGGHGMPFVFEAAGDPQTFQQMVDCAAPAGGVAVVGIPAEDRLSFRHSIARRKGLDVLMIRRSNRTLERAMTWAQTGRLPVSRLVSHHWPMSQVQLAFEVAANYADGVVKGIVNP